jgi:3',5'-cyclic AMP phosphodiesterase CpdA
VDPRSYVPAAITAACALLAACRTCPAVPADRAWAHRAPVVASAPPLRADAVRILVGGDSRKGFAGGAGRSVLRWAFEAARVSGASAFLYLGDMERTPPADAYFPADLATLDPRITFCPAFGNHETLLLGTFDVYADDLGPRRFVRDYLGRCLAPAELPTVAERAARGRAFYAKDLPGGVHFVALDDVSPEMGFGEEQLVWLAEDLAAARGRGARIVVGMHKALADGGVSGHSLDEDVIAADPERVRRESARALALLEDAKVDLVIASHEHGYWEFAQRGARGRPLRSFITGGLGAPLRQCAGPEHAFFHVLVLDVPLDATKGIEVTTLRAPPG